MNHDVYLLYCIKVTWLFLFFNVFRVPLQNYYIKVMKNEAVVFVIAIGLFWTNIVSSQDGFCSNVQKMHQHCVDGGSTSLRPRVGKSGPKGEKGEKCTNEEVDYDMIQRIVDEEVAGKQLT